MKDDILKIKKQIDEDKKLINVITLHNKGIPTGGNVLNGLYYEDGLNVGILASKVKKLKDDNGVVIKFIDSQGNSLGSGSVIIGGEMMKECYFMYVLYSKLNILDSVELKD